MLKFPVLLAAIAPLAMASSANAMLILDDASLTGGSNPDSGYTYVPGDDPYVEESASSPVNVAEPGTLALIGTGLLGLAFVRRWRSGAA